MNCTGEGAATESANLFEAIAVLMVLLQEVLKGEGDANDLIIDRSEVLADFIVMENAGIAFEYGRLLAQSAITALRLQAPQVLMMSNYSTQKIDSILIHMLQDEDRRVADEVIRAVNAQTENFLTRNSRTIELYAAVARAERH